jgi:hypothetical protein
METHHRSPASFIPTDRSVVEYHLQHAVIVDRDLVGQPRADGVNFNRFGRRHLAHHVDIMDPAIDERRKAGHQALVPFPRRAIRLLVEVHPEHQRRSEFARNLDELDP